MRLRVPNATMSTVVEDIILVTKKEVNAGNVEVLKNLIIGLNSYVKKEQKHVVQTQLSRLDKTAYIPVREPGKRAATLMVASDKFFVADRKTLQEEFAEDLPFLNFTVDEVRHMQPLIQALKIGGKSLLACVSQSYEMDGSRLQDTDLTKTIREKSVIINRLVKFLLVSYCRPRTICMLLKFSQLCLPLSEPKGSERQRCVTQKASEDLSY